MRKLRPYDVGTGTQEEVRGVVPRHHSQTEE